MNKWAANIQISFGKSIKLLNKCPFFSSFTYPRSSSTSTDETIDYHFIMSDSSAGMLAASPSPTDARWRSVAERAL